MKKPETPRERVEDFIARRGEDVGKFVSLGMAEDGYVRVEFERAVYFTPPDDRVVYKEGVGYERPALRRKANE